MRLKYTGHQDRSRFKHRFGTPPGTPCIWCGRRVYPVNAWIRLVNGGTEVASLEEPGDLGWQAIGADCAKRLPPEFVKKS
jgi:hypothetical protein